MSRKFIQIRDGLPFMDPILESNLLEVYQNNIDLNNLPPEIKEFIDSSPPEIGPYEKIASSYYGLKDDHVTTYYNVEPLSAAEKEFKILTFQNSIPYPSWSFNEELCKHVPPIPYPENFGSLQNPTGVPYEWNETEQRWDEVPMEEFMRRTNGLGFAFLL